LEIFPAQVQGDAAPTSLCQAIAAATQAGCDVLIVGRGGGSAEDLCAFNTEEVVMAVHHCPIPVISAVGHETDVTLTDAAADLRAPTPSAAAELAVPSMEAMKQLLAQSRLQLERSMTQQLRGREEALARITERLQNAAPRQRQLLAQQQLRMLQQRLEQGIQRQIQRQAAALQRETARLSALSPLQILSRGYALVYGQDGSLLRRAAEAAEGDLLSIQLGRGQLRVKVLERKDDTDDI
jgi:exodeoxyribonuclease VII large subunit